VFDCVFHCVFDCDCVCARTIQCQLMWSSRVKSPTIAARKEDVPQKFITNCANPAKLSFRDCDASHSRMPWRAASFALVKVRLGMIRMRPVTSSENSISPSRSIVHPEYQKEWTIRIPSTVSSPPPLRIQPFRMIACVRKYNENKFNSSRAHRPSSHHSLHSSTYLRQRARRARASVRHAKRPLRPQPRPRNCDRCRHRGPLCTSAC